MGDHGSGRGIEPDLPPLCLEESFVAQVRDALPELPRAKRRRLVDEMGLSPYAAHVVTGHPKVAALFEEAGSIREARTGRVITYSRKVFIPLTNLCRDRCGYCTFARQPGDGLAHTMTPEEVLAVARAGRQAGCKEALFSLGDKPELRYPEYREWLAARGHHSTIDYLLAMCRLVFEETGLLPHANPGLLSREEMMGLPAVNASLGMMLQTASRRFPAPGRSGPVAVMPWSGDAWPTDWGSARKGKRRGRRHGRKSPRPGARTGPVRSARR